MLKTIGKGIVHILGYALALLLATRFIPGVLFTGTVLDLLEAGTILAVIHALLRPILRLIFGPVIFLTVGLFAIIINVFCIYLLDILVEPLTMQGYVPLVLTTLLASVVSSVVHVSNNRHESS